MRRRQSRSILTALAVYCSASLGGTLVGPGFSSASADEPAAAGAHEPSREDMAEAKRHFEQGVALYNEGNYAAALAEFDAAYKLYRSPAVLKNIGLTQKALFRYSEAIESLERFIEEAKTNKKIKPEDRQEVEQLVAELRALLSVVDATITPAGATVIVDGHSAGAAPIAPLKLSPGTHIIEVSAEGYKPARRELNVAARQAQKLDIFLESVPRNGKVRVTSNQALSTVKVDGTVVGTAPVDIELLAGGHSLEVSAGGFVTHRSELVVSASQQRTVAVQLEAPVADSGTPTYKKWWPWTIAAVVVGGVAAGVAIPLATAKPEDPILGTLSPGAGKVN